MDSVRLEYATPTMTCEMVDSCILAAFYLSFSGFGVTGFPPCRNTIKSHCQCPADQQSLCRTLVFSLKMKSSQIVHYNFFFKKELRSHFLRQSCNDHCQPMSWACDTLSIFLWPLTVLTVRKINW